MGARFDDISGGGRSFTLTDPVAEYRTCTLGEVRDTITAAAQAAARGSWVAGYVAYEAAPAFDPALVVAPRPPTEPLVLLTAYRHRTSVAPPPCPATAPQTGWEPDWSETDHARAVAVVRELIACGSLYQVNLTTRCHAAGVDPEELYARMLWGQRCRYGALLTSATEVIVSASPELFFSVAEDQVVLRPMKGTRPRGRWPAEDEALARALTTSVKDRAENVMIVDLVRSDIGRVAATGTVCADPLFVLEGYPTVWQLTSTVTAQLPPGRRLVDMFDAVFPSGSVTGAPKVAAMKAIASLETGPRGPYCGAIGFIEPGAPTRATFSVAIRTAVVDRATGAASYGTGGGITWSSDAGAEWEELVAKTAVLDAVPGGGLLETMRCEPDGTVRNRERHLGRLARSAAMLGIPFDRPEAEAVVDRQAAPGRVRLLLHGDGALDIETAALPSPEREPVRLAVLPASVRSGDRSLYHKVLDRTRYAAWRAACPGADDVILVNERGEVTETTIANLAVLRAGRWWTPPVASGLLAGIEREMLLESGSLAETVLRPDDLIGVPIAVVNSLRGWRPACLVSPG